LQVADFHDPNPSFTIQFQNILSHVVQGIFLDLAGGVSKDLREFDEEKAISFESPQ
jgi:hypothetical protein